MPLPPGLAVFIEHLLTHATPLHEYGVLARTCKEARALMKERLWAHKWTTFHTKFLMQLDFVERFISAHNITQNDTDLIILRASSRPHLFVASVQRSWDFIRETVTLTLRIKQQASTAREEEVAWKGWEFMYTYDPTLSAQSNFESINTRIRRMLREHRRTLTATEHTVKEKKERNRWHFATAFVVLVSTALLIGIVMLGLTASPS
jgi:hypothetical protein